MVNIQAELTPLVQNIEANLSTPLTQSIEVDLSSGIVYAFSPIANISLMENGNYLITITDKMGTTTAQIPVTTEEEIEQWFIENLVTGIKGSAQENYRIGNVNITPSNIGLGNVDNTSDLNKPVSLETQQELNKKPNIYADTIKNWRVKANQVSERNAIYIFTNYKTKIDEETEQIINIPGVKIGDGLAYIIDLPFIQGGQSMLQQHILNNFIHITQQQREFWNNKVSISSVNNEEIVFTTN